MPIPSRLFLPVLAPVLAIALVAAGPALAQSTDGAELRGEDGAALTPVSKEVCYQHVTRCYVDEHGFYLGPRAEQPAPDPFAAEEAAMEEIGKNYAERLADAPLVRDGAAVAVGVLGAATETVVEAIERGYQPEDHEGVTVKPGKLGQYLDRWQQRGREAVDIQRQQQAE